MTQVQDRLAALKLKGWTWAAIADEMGTYRETVSRWSTGHNKPANPTAVISDLDALLTVRRIPKRKRYAPGSRRTTVNTQ
jgi:transcriptional regulator with XRE-family HTH domain